jgi:hypothetical protein
MISELVTIIGILTSIFTYKSNLLKERQLKKLNNKIYEIHNNIKVLNNK